MRSWPSRPPVRAAARPAPDSSALPSAPAPRCLLEPAALPLCPAAVPHAPCHGGYRPGLARRSCCWRQPWILQQTRCSCRGDVTATRGCGVGMAVVTAGRESGCQGPGGWRRGGNRRAACERWGGAGAGAMPIRKATIMPRGHALGMVRRLLPSRLSPRGATPAFLLCAMRPLPDRVL